MASFISYTKLKLTNDTNDKLGFLTRAVAPNPWEKTTYTDKNKKIQSQTTKNSSDICSFVTNGSQSVHVTG